MKRTEPTYVGGFVDALALVTITLLIIGAAMLAGGCEGRSVPPDSGGCDFEVLDVGAAEDPVCPELYCECADNDDCFGYGGVADPIRGTCGPSDVCTVACESDEDCGEGTCGPDEVAGVIVCTRAEP